MTQPLPPEWSRFQPPSFADRIADEERLVAAGTKGCGFTCHDGCHGLACVRLEHPHHGDHYLHPTTGAVLLPGEDIPDGARFVPQDRVVHVGRGADGTLIQFSGPHITPEQAAANAAQAKADNAKRTRDFLESLDQDVIAAFVSGAAR